jgi:hypothetical protein
MKRLLLAISLSVVAAALAPIASASATPGTFTGACKISGTAEFGGAKLSTKQPKQALFSFTANAATSKCEGTPAGAVFNSASVHGEGQLACSVSNGAAEVEILGKVKGEGEIEISGSKAKFGFKFAGAGALVPFTATAITPLVAATGTASFVTDQKGVEACASEEGPTALAFEAVTTGTFQGI